MNRHALALSPYVRWLALLAAALFLSCSVKTEYVKQPFLKAVRSESPENQTDALTFEVPRLFTQTCLDSERVRRLIKCDPEFTAIRRVDASGITQQFGNYHVSCPAQGDPPPTPKASDEIHCDHKNVQVIPRTQEIFAYSNTIALQAQPSPSNESGHAKHASAAYSQIERQVEMDNAGLFQSQDNAISDFDQFFLDGKTHALKHSPRVSALPSNSLVLLSMSARNSPQADTPKGLAALADRGQAALIDYAGKVIETKDQAQHAPDAPTLLKTLTAGRDSAFPPTEKVELTISNALNSASEQDRIQYVAAYLLVPRLPGRTNGRVDRNREYARHFQRCVIAAAPDQRSDKNLLQACEVQALQSLMVWIDNVDALITKPTTISYGSLQNTASITPSASIAPPGAPASGGISGTLSSQRTENLTRELDVRSAWLSPDRSTLRITQRGVEEATIAGSVVTTVTLHVPVSQLDAIEASDDPDAAGSLKATTDYRLAGEPPSRCRKIQPARVKVDEIDEPLYKEVDGLDAMVATARLARPGDWRNFWDRFKKEPDGLAFTSVSGPHVIPLWKNPRTVQIFQIEDLLSAEAQAPDNVDPDTRSILLAMWPSGIAIKELAIAQDSTAFAGLLRALNQHRIGLEKTTGENPGWYDIVDCALWETLSKTAQDSILKRARPGVGEVWLGEESANVGNVPIPQSTLGLDQLACQKFVPCATASPGSHKPVKQKPILPAPAAAPTH